MPLMGTRFLGEPLVLFLIHVWELVRVAPLPNFASGCEAFRIARPLRQGIVKLVREQPLLNPFLVKALTQQQP
jgi:hypothetical protein